MTKPAKRGSRTLAPDPREIAIPGPEKRVETLRPVGTDGASLSVIVERRKVATVETSWAMDNGLRADSPWTEALAESVYRAAKRRAAFTHAVRLLGTRQRSSYDLTRRLRRAGHDEQDAKGAVQRLIEAGILSDTDFATRAAEELARSGKFGARAIELRLRTKGVQGDLARASARAAIETEGDEDAVHQVAEKRARQLTRLEPAVARRRLYAFLIRRGFEHDEARRATDAALADGAQNDLHSSHHD